MGPGVSHFTLGQSNATRLKIIPGDHLVTGLLRDSVAVIVSMAAISIAIMMMMMMMSGLIVQRGCMATWLLCCAAARLPGCTTNRMRKSFGTFCMPALHACAALCVTYNNYPTICKPAPCHTIMYYPIPS